MRRVLPALVLILAACGSPSTPQAHASLSPIANQTSASQSPAAPKPSPSPALGKVLFAVVEYDSRAPDTVAIVGMDGYARAKAHFQPRTEPEIPDAYWIQLQSAVQVVGSAAYYIDATGTIRALRVGSQPQVVARFPQQPAQEDTWFAVSPDGSQVMVGALTLPALGTYPTLIGPWRFDLASAVVGGQLKSLVHFEYPVGSTGPKPTFPIGWTSAGPIATLPVSLSITPQNSWFGGPLYRIDDSGKQTEPVGGPDCYAAAVTPSGLIPCANGKSPVTIRDQAGNVIWTAHIGGDAQSLFISPDGQAIANGDQVERRVGGVVKNLKLTFGLYSGFVIEGWLDNNTIVGRFVNETSGLNLGWVSLDHPTAVHDFGFKGDFVAIVPTA